MANPHYGEITDVWKHLPLAEMLAKQPAEFYWESHAGSARYAFTPTPARDYGVGHFLRNAVRFPRLEQSAYLTLLRECEEGGRLVSYPGSPTVAMHLLRGAEQFLFCDTNAASLATIEQMARELGFADEQVLTAAGEGSAIVSSAVDLWSDERLEELFVFLDPFDMYLAIEGGPTPLQLFAKLARRGARSVFWYAYYEVAHRDYLMRALAKAFEKEAAEAREAVPEPWWAEIAPEPFPNKQFEFNPESVRACGILCANLERSVLEGCSVLGHQLSESYVGSTVAEGVSGEIGFRCGPLA